MENLFLPIDELIFAPINAIKEANISLSNGILKQIAIFSDTENENTDISVMKLKNIKFLYDKIKSTEYGKLKETIGLTVPTASIIPLSALQINSSVIKFNIEVKSNYDENNNFSLIGKNAPEKIRKSDFIPKIHFNIKTESAELPEGIARLIDVLDTNQIPNIENKLYVDSDGLPYENQHIHSIKNKEIYEMNKLSAIIDQINKLIISLERQLKNKSDKSYEQYSVSGKYNSETDKLYNWISELKEDLTKYNSLKNDKENNLINIEMDILEENMNCDK